MLTSQPPAVNFVTSGNLSSLDNGSACKRKRRPAGTPDPGAEVVSLSPRTLMESDRYVCEICNQGFQRDQNLQMHRRRHKVPWKLLKRESGSEVRKRVFVCPEESCLHHDPCHALGDLVGIKKHFRRKHSAHKQWVCAKCAKAYAVQSDYKAHLKTCGTRGHSCDCGRVFSRVESFIEHQDVCNAGRAPTAQPVACLSRTSSSPCPSSETSPTFPGHRIPNPSTIFIHPALTSLPTSNHRRELQLLPAAHVRPAFPAATPPPAADETHITKLQLSVGWETRLEPKEDAKRQVELAEREFANAKWIRQQAQAELDRANAMRDHAIKTINSALMEITCQACKQSFRTKNLDENLMVGSYMSSVVTEGGREDPRISNT